MKAGNLLVTTIIMLSFVPFFVPNNQAEPKYLKREAVGKAMVEWNKALGVNCDFCHTSNRSQTYKILAGKTVNEKELSALVH